MLFQHASALPSIERTYRSCSSWPATDLRIAEEYCAETYLSCALARGPPSATPVHGRGIALSHLHIKTACLCAIAQAYGSPNRRQALSFMQPRNVSACHELNLQIWRPWLIDIISLASLTLLHDEYHASTAWNMDKAFQSLENLYLGSNLLTGPLPAYNVRPGTLAWSKLQIFDVANCSFTGEF